MKQDKAMKEVSILARAITLHKRSKAQLRGITIEDMLSCPAYERQRLIDKNG